MRRFTSHFSPLILMAGHPPSLVIHPIGISLLKTRSRVSGLKGAMFLGAGGRCVSPTVLYLPFRATFSFLFSLPVGWKHRKLPVSYFDNRRILAGAQKFREYDRRRESRRSEGAVERNRVARSFELPNSVREVILLIENSGAYWHRACH